MLTSDGGRMLLPGTDRVDDLRGSIPQGWSRPKGLAFLWTSPDHRKLFKIDAATGKRTDVTFLERTDEAIYHPAGEHIVAVGVDHEHNYGVFLATNEGTEPQLLVVGEDARRIFSLGFGPSGSLFYAAEHPDRYDVHRITFTHSPDTGKVDATLQTMYSTHDEITKIVSSPFSESDVAVQIGACESRTLVAHRFVNGIVMDRPQAIEKLDKGTRPMGDELDGMSTQPVGWLSSGHLLVRAWDSGCSGPSSLYLWTKNGTRLLTNDAGPAAVRVSYPDPPPPPNQETEVVA
jgi:hypothetical protein